MIRLVLCLCLALPAFAVGRPRARVEAAQVITAYVEGSVNLNQLINRLNFLGEQSWAAGELARLWRKTPDPKGARPLVEALSELAGAGDEETEKVLLAALKDDELTTRLPSLRGLARMKSARAGGPIAALLSDHSPAVRREAAKALGEIGQPRSAPALAARVKVEADPEVKATMLLALGQTQDRRQLPVVEPFLAQSSETVRLAAARALCLLGSPKGLEFARGLVGAKEPTERLEGVLLLDGVKGRAADEVLATALADTDHRVRATAARLLLERGDRSKLTWLVLESRNAVGDNRTPYEDQLERLHLSDEDRRAILRRAGVTP